MSRYRHNNIIESNRRRRGYVLVMTLLLLAMAATALAAVASESHRRALQAVKAQDDLQQRWGAISCQRAMLPKAAAIIDASNRGKPVASGKVKLVVKLGRQTFDVLLSDEQAKVNINALSKVSGNRMQDAVVKLVPTDVSLALSPGQAKATDAEGKSIEIPSFDSYGQVFDIDVPPGIVMTRGADKITCWGDGVLNVKRASPETIMQLCAALLTDDESKAFEKERKKSQNRPPEDILTAANVPAEKKAVVEKMLGKESKCFSIWTVSKIQERATYRFAVRTGEDESETRVFEW